VKSDKDAEERLSVELVPQFQKRSQKSKLLCFFAKLIFNIILSLYALA
jgi:hypothetical protein